MHTLLENVGHEVENIDFIYFTRTSTNEVKPHEKESKDIYWFTKEEIESNHNIKPHAKIMSIGCITYLKRYINIYYNIE